MPTIAVAVAAAALNTAFSSSHAPPEAVVPLFEPGEVRIEGSISNAGNTRVLLINPEIVGEVEYLATLDEGGRFEFHVDVLSPHDAELRIDGQLIWIFVAPGETIRLRADMDDLETSLAFEGPGAGTNASMNVFRWRLRERTREQDFGQKKDELPPDEFMSFARTFFEAFEQEVESIEARYQPDPRGRAWMRNYLRFQLGEDLAEYATRRSDELPPDFFGFEPGLLDRRPQDLECSQFYGDGEFMSKYHIVYPLSRLPGWGSFLEQLSLQTEDGMRAGFEFLDRHLDDELVKRLIITQFMTRLIESELETAGRLFETYSAIVPDPSFHRFIRQRIEARTAFQPLVRSLDELAESDLIGSVFQRIRDDHGGTVIYMDIWATWCAACITTFPAAKQLARDLEGTGVQPIYVCTSSEQEAWAAMSSEHGLPEGASYFLTREQSRELRRLLRYTGLPRYVIFDRDGTIVDEHAKQPTSGALRAELLNIAGE
jgi:thiol-disulfide isomerase/thioredoxin